MVCYNFADNTTHKHSVAVYGSSRAKFFQRNNSVIQMFSLFKIAVTVSA